MIPPIILGLIIIGYMTRNKKELKRKPQKEQARVLRVIDVPKIDVVPRVLGYGTAKPGRIWRAIAEVKGHIIVVHPELKSGSIILENEEILRIDPTEYNLTIIQLTADIEQVNAEIEELKAREKNDKSSLVIEEASLSLAQHALERNRILLTTNAVSEAQVDHEEREVLAQKQKLQSLKNSINLYPSQTKFLQSKLAVHKSKLVQANLDLEKTIIKTPFSCRIGEVELEKDQFLAIGELLFEAHSIDVTEVEAQVLLDKARNLIHPDNQKKLAPGINPESISKIFDIKAKVRLQSGDFKVEWDGRFAGIREQVDPQTRTLGIIIAVDHPYAKAIPGKRPPLVKGTFCEVELIGKIRRSQIVIPRSAYHQGNVYLVNREYRLEKREVKALFSQTDFICLASGLKKGEKLIVSDPTPIIEGMLVKPIMNYSILTSLTSEAIGESNLK